MSVTISHINVVRFLLSTQLFIGGLISYLCYMCLFADSGVHHILCSVFCFACPHLLYPNEANFSGLSILFVPSVFAKLYLYKHRTPRRSQDIGVTSLCSFNV
jgi:hypothetical protein